jgi:hypothetical protein
MGMISGITVESMIILPLASSTSVHRSKAKAHTPHLNLNSPPAGLTFSWFTFPSGKIWIYSSPYQLQHQSPALDPPIRQTVRA